MKSRVLKNGENQITQNYKDSHRAVDLVKYKAQTEFIIAHTDGEVVEVVKNYNRTDTTGCSYGNYVKLKHPNGYYTLYAHLKYKTVTVSKGAKVKKGDVIGYMGNTGRSQGAHLHFEVRDKSNVRINPTPYLNANLPNMKVKTCEYRVYNNKHWYATVKDGVRAGNINDKTGISGIQFKSYNAGYFLLQAYDKKYGWLPEVIKWDDTDNGYAGVKNSEIQAFRIKSELGKIRYRAYDLKLKKWLPWVTGYNKDDSINGYAGIKGHPVGAIEVEFI